MLVSAVCISLKVKVPFWLAKCNTGLGVLFFAQCWVVQVSFNP